MTTPHFDIDEFRADIGQKGEDVAALTVSLESARVLLRESVLAGLGAGISELEASKLAGVTRDSVRRWAGK